MTSRLVKAVRRVFRIKPRPRRLAADCTREGHVFSLNHEYYGPLRVLAEDQYISWNVADGRSLWEPDLVKIFRREVRAGKDVLDVGANLGLHSIVLAKCLAQLGHGGKVLAFEPHPEIFPLAKFNGSRCANLELIPKAASDSAKTFYMPSVMSLPNAGGVGVIEGPAEHLLPVESIAIDSLQLENVGFMKVDVEGHELATIAGAKETIRRCRPTMVIEVMGGHRVQTAPPTIAAEIRRRVAFVCDLGYTAEQVSDHDYLFRPRS